MSYETRILGALFIVAYLAVLVRMVRRQRLRAKYTFLWLGIGVAILLLVAVPGMLETLSEWTGIFYPPSLLFVSAIALLMFVSLHFSWELSRLEDRTRTLAEGLAMADSEIRELNERLQRHANSMQ